MSSAKRQPAEQAARYSIAELVEMRRQILLYARALPPGPERNEHRQVAVSLGRLFKDPRWRGVHTVEGSR